jgi:hypothetical protein
MQGWQSWHSASRTSAGVVWAPAEPAPAAQVADLLARVPGTPGDGGSVPGGSSARQFELFLHDLDVRSWLQRVSLRIVSRQQRCRCGSESGGGGSHLRKKNNAFDGCCRRCAASALLTALSLRQRILNERCFFVEVNCLFCILRRGKQGGGLLERMSCC